MPRNNKPNKREAKKMQCAVLNEVGQDRAPLRALSIRQPWAWLIFNAGKNIENRSWPSHFRGPVAIHAAKRCSRAEYQEARQFIARAGLNVKLPPLEALERGGIVGVCEIVDCVSTSDSPWFMGRYGFVLANVRPVPFQRCNGALGFFFPNVEVAV